MKIKEYLNKSPKAKLEGLKVRSTNSVVGYITSIGNCIVFLNNNADGQTDRGRLYPQIIMKDEDILAWDIVDEKIACNCDILTNHKNTIHQ